MMTIWRKGTQPPSEQSHAQKQLTKVLGMHPASPSNSQKLATLAVITTGFGYILLDE